jgi:hypothetical protein
MRRTIIFTALLALFVTSTFAQHTPSLTDDDIEASKKPKPTEAPATTTNSNWIEVAPDSSGFKILMPGRPTATTKTLELPTLGNADLHQLQLTDDKFFYKVVYFQMPTSETVNTNSQSFRDALFIGMVQGFIRTAKGELIKETTINFQGSEGRDIQIKTANMMVWSRMFLINGVMYSLTFGSKNNETENLKKFFGSFASK